MDGDLPAPLGAPAADPARTPADVLLAAFRGDPGLAYGGEGPLRVEYKHPPIFFGNQVYLTAALDDGSVVRYADGTPAAPWCPVFSGPCSCGRGPDVDTSCRIRPGETPPASVRHRARWWAEVWAPLAALVGFFLLLAFLVMR